MKAFLTGATGQVGSAILRHLTQAGHEVTATVRSEQGGEVVRERGGVSVDASLFDLEALAHAVRGHDVIFHAAGINGFCLPNTEEMFATNVNGSVNVVRAALKGGVPKVVYTSSAVTVGEEQGTFGNEGTKHRGWYLSAYEKSKVEAERAVGHAAEDLGVNVVSVNPASVQGPGRSGGTARLFIAYLKGRLRFLPDTRATLVDVDDCARAHLTAAAGGQKGARYIVAGATLTTAEMMRALAEASGVDRSVQPLSPMVARVMGAVVGGAYGLARRKAPVCPEMVRTMLFGHAYDGSRIVRELGFTYTPIEDTLARMVEWYRAEGLV